MKTKRNLNHFLLLIAAMWMAVFSLFAQENTNEYLESCTSIMVGKKASADGSVFTSHTDDSHRTRSWIDIKPAKKHKPGRIITNRLS